MLNNLSHRALTGVLLRIAKLGGRTVKVNTQSIIVLTPKYSLHDAISFVQFIINSLQDDPMLLLLSFTPAVYWCPLVMVDRHNHAGLCVEASTAITLTQSEALPNEGTFLLHGNHLRYSCCFTSQSMLPVPVMHLFQTRVQEVMCLLFNLLCQVCA